MNLILLLNRSLEKYWSWLGRANQYQNILILILILDKVLDKYWYCLKNYNQYQGILILFIGLERRSCPSLERGYPLQAVKTNNSEPPNISPNIILHAGNSWTPDMYDETRQPIHFWNLILKAVIFQKKNRFWFGARCVQNEAKLCKTWFSL